MLSSLHYRQDQLYIENVSLKKIAEKYGTPCYVYSKKALITHWQIFEEAFKNINHCTCYAVKANSNLAILNLFAKLNAGFDIVSIGELERVIKAGGDPKKIMFSGVGKTSIEMKRAIEVGIHCFDIESEAELQRLNHIASSLNTTVSIALRVNPNVNPRTHAYISTGLTENKFGIEANHILRMSKQLRDHQALKLIGLACHIGSQITELEPFLLALDCLIDLYQQLKKIDIHLQHINIGGGLGIRYRDETPLLLHDYANAIKNKLSSYPLQLILEPGRALVGTAGTLLTCVEYIKPTSQKNFAIVDAGMNDLIRPALYEAWQPILPITLKSLEKRVYDIAGPVCESADFLGKQRELAIEAGDLLAVDIAGAYGFSMSSNYNSRPRPPEILVDGDDSFIIRRRESITDLFAAENVIGNMSTS